MCQGPDRKQMAHLNWVTGEKFNKGTIYKGLGSGMGRNHKERQCSSASGGITGGSSNRIYRESAGVRGLPIRELCLM